MLYGTVPFKGNDMNELHKLIIKGEFELKDDISIEARALLRQILEVDPRARISTEEILAHPWLSDAKDEVEIFIDTEKERIRKEFIYNDARNLNRNTQP